MYTHIYIYIYIYILVWTREYPFSFMSSAEWKQAEFSGAESAPWNSFFETVFQAAFAYTGCLRIHCDFESSGSTAHQKSGGPSKSKSEGLQKWSRKVASAGLFQPILVNWLLCEPEWTQKCFFLQFLCVLASPSEPKGSRRYSKRAWASPRHDFARVSTWFRKPKIDFARVFTCFCEARCDFARVFTCFREPESDFARVFTCFREPERARASRKSDFARVFACSRSPKAH